MLVDQLYESYSSDGDKPLAFAILHELMGRNGFDGWFDNIDEDTQEELLETLLNIEASHTK